MNSLPTLECRQWYAVIGLSCTVVVAATKEDARILAAHRFRDAGLHILCERAGHIRVREATPADLERFYSVLGEMAVRGRRFAS